ncbi:hypothetical protein SporoP37_15970 [Sporosarcina sp. P37]|uniref:peptidoglycan DD-metalloendopeptidase family protein n=1 Tax=unclassified Sporosarcina TaxID=2647733 RepID=UPI000A17DDF4|nr:MULTISPECIES: peptidoglycan DD-metalloendopeptidase family protein [unclassified Sporosarcina]ARK26023.1 hypothetical protein SporoP37_15970 [Sporosarcina sp. P37]PID19392.1 hypothetical protein CSV62_02490 [Sporosarcina sp. P35]
MSYIKPTNGYITSFFAPARKHPKEGVVKAHQGVDIGSADDNRVWAAASGRVAQVGYSDTAGNFVLIRHSNGDTTSYSHLASTSVKYLQTVEQGQVIGKKGRTGSATGVHLHFEIVRGKYTDDFTKKRDPLLYFKDPLTEEQQGLLVKLGYKLDVDGYYGQEMKAAVTQYQKDRGLTADGYAGHATHAALKADVAKQVASDSKPASATSTLTLTFTSGTSRRLVETFIGSRAQQEIAIKMAIDQGYSEDWKTRDKEDGDLVGLIIAAAVELYKSL